MMKLARGVPLRYLTVNLQPLGIFHESYWLSAARVQIRFVAAPKVNCVPADMTI